MSNSPTKPELLAELVSPSKRIKQIFRNRNSNPSIESISEAPENPFEPEHATASELFPSKSPARSITSGFSNFMRTRNSRPSVSLELRSSSEALPQFIHKKDPVRVEDFADSSEGSHEYDSDSVNSILQEYEVKPHRAEKKEFIFQENFDESAELSSSARPITMSSMSSASVYHDCTQTLPASRPANRHNSRRHTVLSSSSNIDEDKSILMISTISTVAERSDDIRYPDPEITVNDTPIKSHGDSSFDRIDDKPLQPLQQPQQPQQPQGNIIDNKTRERNSAYTHRSSISSGELLSRLEASYDVSGRRQMRPVSGLNNFTARLDSRTELPVMLYRVENESFDEKRWSLVESQRDSARERKSDNIGSHDSSASNESTRLYPGQKMSIQTDHSESSFSGIDPRAKSPQYSNLQGRFQTDQIGGDGQGDGHGENRGSGSNSGSNSNSGTNSGRGSGSGSSSGPISGSSHQKSSIQSYFDRLQQSKNNQSPQSKPAPRMDPETSPNHPKSPEESPHQFITRPPRTEKIRDSEERKTSHERMFYEKDIFHLPPITKRYHSWFYFLVIMIVGLVAPPVYYLVTLGVMDRRRSRHGPQPRFLRGQKFVSLAIGIVWILVVLAMIGVGFGVGQTT